MGKHRTSRHANEVVAGDRAPAIASTDARGEPAGRHDPGPLGVVFVHGLGSQPRGETIINWSSAIQRAVAAWAATCPHVDRGLPEDRVVSSAVDFDGSAAAYVRISVPGRTVDDHHFERQEWVMTEAWWAQHMQPPSFATMVDWCGPGGVVATVVQRLMGSLSGWPSVLVVLSKVGFGLFLSVACTILLLLYGILRTFSALIPVKQVQDAINQVQLDTVLTRWWGGAYLLLEAPVQSANIRRYLADSINGLRRAGCTRIVVVAHSAGTIVSHMLLSDESLEDVRADTLITHGEAIQMGREISDTRRLEPPLRLGDEHGRHARWVDFWASRDPAPCGSLDEFPHPVLADARDEREARRNVVVWNRNSVLDDHGTYWDNDEEFVYPLLRELELAGTNKTRSRFDVPRLPIPVRDHGDGPATWIRRRRERVAMLTLWVRMLFVIPLCAAVGAFVVERPGMVQGAGRSLFGFVGSNKDVKGLADSVGTLVQPPAIDDVFFAGGLLAIATVVLAALVHAALPIWQHAVWRDHAWRRVFFVLDAAPSGVVAVIAGMGVVKFRDWIGGQGIGVSAFALIGAVIVLVIIGVAIAALSGPGTSRRLTPSQNPLLAAVLMGLVAAVIVAVVYALARDDGIRSWTAGAIVVFVGFQALGAVGRWRWRVWDENEREVFRGQAFVEKPAAPARVWAVGQIGLLGAAAVLAGVGVAFDLRNVVAAAVVVTGLVVLVGVMRDAAIRAEWRRHEVRRRQGPRTEAALGIEDRPPITAA